MPDFATERCTDQFAWLNTAPAFLHMSRAREVKEPLVPCGASLGTFPLCPKNTSVRAMDFWLTERIHASNASRTSLFERKYPVGDRTR